ncbi:MAG TPA: hypothetical protein VJJ24_01585 [Candidatus Paceibacterota bacterium]
MVVRVLKDFGIKFVDIVAGVVLGLGFSWWPNLHESWQYIAFVFVYLNLIDYWIDYAPTLRKFPLKREVDVVIHTLIMFGMFALVYTTQLTTAHFMGAFILFRVADLMWLLRIKREYRPGTSDSKFIHAWISCGMVELVFSIVILITSLTTSAFSPLGLLIVFIFLRLLSRLYASWAYKSTYFS